MRYFKRFSTFHDSTWGIQRDKWDGICFTPNRDITVFGMALFERHPSGGQFKLDYKYRIKDAGDNIVTTSDKYEEVVIPVPQ